MNGIELPPGLLETLKHCTKFELNTLQVEFVQKTDETKTNQGLHAVVLERWASSA